MQTRKGADQPVHLRSLITPIAVDCLEDVTHMLLLSHLKILCSLCSCAQTTKTIFGIFYAFLSSDDILVCQTV